MSLCRRQGFLDITSCYGSSVAVLTLSPKITSPFYKGSDKAARRKKELTTSFQTWRECKGTFSEKKYKKKASVVVIDK